MTVIPLDDRILVRPTEALREYGLTDTAVNHPDDRLVRGTVIAAGTGTLDGPSQNKPPAVQAGDTILFARHLACEVTFGGVRYWMMKASDVANIEARAVTVVLYRAGSSARCGPPRVTKSGVSR
jgi:chaperonin GroES